jgi:hypothetical protein
MKPSASAHAGSHFRRTHTKGQHMKKLIALTTVGIAAAVGTAYATHPDDCMQVLDMAQAVAMRAWANIEGNPVPVLVALGTFLATIIYHKLKGKSFRESVEVAATRVTVVPVPRGNASDAAESTVVTRAKARATRAQLIADQIGLENRIRKLPAEVKAAEKDACYSEQSLADAQKSLAAKQQAHEDAVAKLETLRTELAAGEAELAAIADELKKLAEVA